MLKTERVLLARRTTDGLYLRLEENRHTTSYEYVVEPELAKRTTPHNAEDLENPHEAAYYFENSSRARNIWLKDCNMVPFEIVTEITAKAI